VVNNVALVCQISIQKSTKNHDLVVRNSNGSEL